MSEVYERDFDLNLLRVFLVVAEQGSVTAAAKVLYVTQPAVSAALKRLQRTIDAELFVRQGRGLALTAAGRELASAARPHLEALLDATRTTGSFDPLTSNRVVRLGLADANEQWLLPALLSRLAEEAPMMALVVLPVQFRTVGDALASAEVDLAVTVADEVPAGIVRKTLFTGGFVALYNPTLVELGPRPSKSRYLAAEHVIVSYNGDRRGILEDLFGVSRTVRVSVPSFHSIGAIVDESPLIATVPTPVAASIRRLRPHLATAKVPFPLEGAPMELLWRSAVDKDPAVSFVADRIALSTRDVAATAAAALHPR